MSRPTSEGLTVAVTGPTGDLGIGIVSALERSRSVKRIEGMARRPFDPAERGWKKTDYRQGDVTDVASVRDLVKGADVVVHLAFAILTASDATRELNVAGSRLVFEEAAKAGVERICYASSVAAYGFHDDNPDWLTEEVQPRGSPEHPYSQQKAEVERVLAELLEPLGDKGLLRYSDHIEGNGAQFFKEACKLGLEGIVSKRVRSPYSPGARTMLQEIPYYRLSQAMPERVARLLGSMPALKPVIPDPGTPFQLVHEDDVARAFVAGVRGLGEPGPYNLAGRGRSQGQHPILIGGRAAARDHAPHRPARRGRRARLVLRARAEAGGGDDGRSGDPGAARSRVGGVDPLG